MKILTEITNATLHINLSYKEFFGTYDPYKDGQAFIATYSFNHNNFDFWEKLEPLSVIYISDKYKTDGLRFLRRFPLFEVYSVRQLHSKAVFFYDSGRLLLGSENLYMSESTFSELMIEVVIPKAQRDEVIDTVFRSLSGEILTCKYTLSDLKISKDGYPYFPCENEVDYWDLIANRIFFDKTSPHHEYNNPSYIYMVYVYNIMGVTYYLAFNRGYAYCGDINEECFNWLLENCKIKQHNTTEQGFPISTSSELVESSPRKDYFFKYHPIASQHKAVEAFWFDGVKNLFHHQSLIKPIELKDITKRKIHRPK